MRRFRKKFSPATPTTDPPPTSPIVEYLKQELATFHPRVKDQRALAASSSAIALSIASPTCSPVDDALDEPGSSKESSWKTAYGAARMAVEIANASSDMFLPLKAVVGALSVLIKNYDQSTANAEQIREIEGRVQSLSEILTSPVGDRDGEEKARRKVLRKKLAGIIAKLRPLSEQHGLVKLLKNVDHSNILKSFVQDLGYAVSDYQTSIQQGIYENTKKIDANTRHIIEATELELLGKLDPVYNAGYQAAHHETCLRGTRESVLDGIMRWAKDPQERHVFWLNGLAGTGKSTIAQTFSEMAAKTGILGASFFCSRDYLDRKELKNIFPTLSYQLACRYPAFRDRVVQTIKQDPSVARTSLISQLKDLVIEPLSSTGISCVIVVDALDECVDDQPASAILSVLGRYIKLLPSIKFLITGRPEPRIRTGFRLPLLEPLTQIFLLHQVELISVDRDIRLYLQEKLNAAAKRRSDLNLSDPWPCDGDLTALTKKSSGLFIFASTLARFIESEHHEPNKRLQLIVNPPDSTVHEGRAGVDPLYTQVFLLAFSDVEETAVFENLKRVLGAVVLAFNPLSGGQISKILGIDASITTTLRHLHSVLLVPNEDSKEIRVFHKSFPDFLQDPSRCCDSRFFIDPSVHHGDMALGCLELLKKLNPDPCGLPRFVMNRDVAHLPSLLKDKVGSATQYACDYWAMHIRSSPSTLESTVQLIASVTEFFKNNAIPWIEVMSLGNRLESVIHSIYDLLDWISMVNPTTSDLYSLAEDCLRFTMHFFHLIQQSAPHIYHSALRLSPTSSMFRSMFHERSSIFGFHGRPDTWGAIVRTIQGSFTCMTAFGHRIAAARDDGAVGIYDSITGVLRLSLSPAAPIKALRGSPDGSLLFCIHQVPLITLWDIQTGGLIHPFVLEERAEDVAISLKGRYLAGGFSNGTVKIWEVANKMEGAGIQSSSSPVTHLCWLEPEERLAVVEEASVRIWDTGTGKLLNHFTMHETPCGVVYSQKINRLAILTASETKSTITIVCPHTGTYSPHIIRHQLTCFAFSQTSKELICGMKTPGLRLFDISTQSSRSFNHSTTITSLSTLSNGTMVANAMDSGIQFLRLDLGHAPSGQLTVTALTVQPCDDDRIFAIIPLNRDSIMLLETSSMSLLLTIPARKNTPIPENRKVILCASYECYMVVHCFEEGGKENIQLWRFWFRGQRVPEWTEEVDEPPLIGRISPTGLLLATYHGERDQAYIDIRDARDGKLKRRMNIDPPRPVPPLKIAFQSDDKFYIWHGHMVLVVWIDLSLWSGTPGISITREWQPPAGDGQLQRHYDLDDTREWVVSGSRKICWIPPGYIRSTQSSYCWVGNSLVMVGQDGTLRKLIFRVEL